ncbi:MAG TPA: TIGR02679 family protein [Chloroflexota bacterium]|nr:TIGR02679 family protein [Chloroflexota bacterium]
MSDPGGAARFLRERGLDRIAALARQKLFLNGRPSGLIRLPDASPDEHAGLAGLTGRRVGQGELRLQLSDLDAWLRASRFACSLEETLAAYFGEPIPSRPQQNADARAAAATAREGFSKTLGALAESFPAKSLARRWLAEGEHGTGWLAQRWGRLGAAERDDKLALIRGVARALARLPLEATPRRLAVFANDCLGNPHALDPAEEAGRLFVQALLDLSGSHAVAAALSTAERTRLYESVGLLVDTISPTVAVFNLREAVRADGAREAFPPGALQVLPLRLLLTWQSLRVNGERVFVVENPVVFEEILDALEPKAAAGAEVSTVLCTAGWPSAAALRALDLLVRGDAEIWLAYSGDFDLAGLRIAASLGRRYPAAFHPWRLSADDYAAALRPSSPAAASADLAALSTLESTFLDLILAIQRAGRWAYQEALAPRLIEDLVESGPQGCSGPRQ